jgi:hypothetical protein
LHAPLINEEEGEKELTCTKTQQAFPRYQSWFVVSAYEP